MKPGDFSSIATRVLEMETLALTQLAANIPMDFEPAVRAILAMRGRLVVSGIGKSGHVARKIAATLASTGTPAYFIHPAEASHGDLGIISESDMCLLLSNSGETSELGDILAYCARFRIPIIAISSRADSTLMRAARFKLILPPFREACPIGMAPTTSTTLSIALGDALAVALMEARGFRAEDFRGLHPGGKLGARMRRVEDLMHGADALPLVSTETTMSEALLTMSGKGFGIAIVVAGDGGLEGVITDGDLRRNMKSLLSHNAGDIAMRNPVTVAKDQLAGQAVSLMNEHKVSVLVVVDAQRVPVGLLHIHDCLRAGVV